MIYIRKLIQAIKSNDLDFEENQDFDADDIKRIMKEYAEYYGEKFRQSILDECWFDDYATEITTAPIIKEIKLPEHE